MKWCVSKEKNYMFDDYDNHMIACVTDPIFSAG
jgi:hypothetical protein